MKYILKNGREVESIPIGKSSVKIGEKNNRLTICDRGPAPTSGRGATVICKCDCGNYTLIKLQSFRNGSTKSCGCFNKEQKKEICKKIGEQSYFKDYSSEKLNNNPFYEFIEPINEKTPLGQKWKIRCKKCNKEYIEIPNQLISLNRNRGNNPCDCWKHISKGVLKLKFIFEQMNIDFIQEYTFDTCVSPKNRLLKFDFYLPKYDLLIEYDGEQHFEDKGMFGDKNHEEKFKIQQKYDEIKNDWCLKNNKKLIRIKYSDFNNINISYIERILNA